MSRQARRWSYNIENEIIAWGKSKGLGRRILDWPVGAVVDAHAEAVRILKGLRASTEGVPFTDLATFRIWLETEGLDAKAHAFGDEARYPASTLKWSFEQAVACYRALEEDLKEAGLRN